jgi:thiamine-monophosphate kinase
MVIEPAAVAKERSVTLADWGEFDFIAALKKRLPTLSESLPLGLGDDASWWRPAAADGVLTTCDMLVEGVHFELATTTPADLGWKALAVNLSDLAAMGGEPECAWLALGLPPTTPRPWLEEFCSAFLELAAQYGVQLAGGDTVRARDLVISVTLAGQPVAGRPILRSGALPEDDIYFSGTLGDSCLGLKLLQQKIMVEDPAARFLQRRHLRPEPRVELGRKLAAAGLVRAMLDVSDGLVADLGHLLRASGGLGARLEEEALPFSVAAEKLLAAGEVALDELLTGGEDFELLFAAPAGADNEIQRLAADCGMRLSRIGRVAAEDGIVLVAADGCEQRLTGRGGHDHFKD